MKKTRIFTTAIGLCLAASMFAGCSQTSDETAVASRIEGGQTQISIEESEGQPVSADGYVFTYMGYDIVMGSEVQQYLDAFGEPDDEFEAASCAGQGMDHIYSYPGFFLYTREENGVSIVDAVQITDSLTDYNGAHVGDKIEDVKAIFGEPADDWGYGFTYSSGNTELRFMSEDQVTVSEIQIIVKN
ncbi:MAG: hypothetical protein IKX97_08550 [Erysipelotrichaceae bacterium]|nr:hypothetical protein [Erysipelotrichaceae bacterium]